jgi:heme/copper-type cytochrome/quinol oxidase subunit 2
MKKTVKRSHLSILTASLLTLAMFFSLSRLVRAQNQNAFVIEITAKKYEYSISPVHVKIGTKVKLKVTATDHDHGF